MHTVRNSLVVILIAALVYFSPQLPLPGKAAHVIAQSTSLCSSLVTLNLYPGPGTASGAPTGQIVPGTGLSILAYSVDEAWMLVVDESGSQQGWISAVAGLTSCEAGSTPSSANTAAETPANNATNNNNAGNSSNNANNSPSNSTNNTSNTTTTTNNTTNNTANNTTSNTTSNTSNSQSNSCRVTVATLNLRPGPGTEYEPPVAKLARGTTVTVLTRLETSPWVEVKVDSSGAIGWINGSSSYVTCGGAATSSATTSQTGTSTTNTAQNNTQNSGGNTQPVIATSPGVITNFESWGSWRRGDETWGTFTQSQSQRHDGSYSGELRYDFPANTSNNYVVFMQSLAIAGQPVGLSAWVYGDGSGNFLNVWVQDANSNLWQFGLGRVRHTGWQEMVAAFDLSAGWPNQAISAGATTLAYPLRFHAFVLDAPDSAASSGTIYIDSLTALAELPVIATNTTTNNTSVANSSGASNTTTTESSQAGQATNTTTEPVVVATLEPEPLPAQVSFRADDTELEPGECTEIRWNVENVQAVYFDGDGVTGHGSDEVCPNETETYDLRVRYADNTSETYTLTIVVKTMPLDVINLQYVGIWYALDLSAEIERVILLNRGTHVDVTVVSLCMPMAGCTTRPATQAKWTGSSLTADVSGVGTVTIYASSSGLNVQSPAGLSTFQVEHKVRDPY